MPYVRTYRYLGVMFNDILSRAEMLKHREVRGRQVLKEISGVIGSLSIPLQLRRQVIVGLLVPAIAFAGELFGFEQFAVQGDKFRGLERLLDDACVMVIRGSRKIPTSRQHGPSGTCYKTMRMEMRLPSIEAIMMGRASRAMLKYPSSKCYVHRMFSKTFGHKSNWVKGIEAKLAKLFKFFGFGGDGEWTTAVDPDGDTYYWNTVTRESRWEALDFRDWGPLPTTKEGWLASSEFLQSKAYQSIRVLGPMTDAVWKALSESQIRGSVEAAATYGSAQNDASKLEGRRIEVLMQDWYYRRDGDNASISLSSYVKSGFQASAKVFYKLSCAHPELAYGFHWLSRIRVGAFLKWSDAVFLAEKSVPVGENKANENEGKHCPCCGRKNALDTVGHFFFKCGEGMQQKESISFPSNSATISGTGMKLAALRVAKVDSYGRLIGLGDTKTQGSDGGKLLDGTQLVTRIFTDSKKLRALRNRFSSDQVMTLLLGGNRTPAGRDSITVHEGSLQELENWKPKTEEETKAVLMVLGKLAGEGKGYAVQKRYRLFELSLVLCARYIDSAMRLRNASFWESCALQKSKEPVGTSQPQSQSRTSAVGSG